MTSASIELLDEVERLAAETREAVGQRRAARARSPPADAP